MLVISALFLQTKIKYVCGVNLDFPKYVELSQKNVKEMTVMFF